MKLVTIKSGNSGWPGALLNSGWVVDLRKAFRFDSEPPISSVADLLSRGATTMKRTADVVAEMEADSSRAIEKEWLFPAERVQLLGPTGHNPMLWTVGPLYPDHLREMGVAETERPTLSAALRNANSIIGSGDAIRLPTAAPDMVDWEGEFALVVGSAAHQVHPSRAMEHIIGYTIYNDVSARDYTDPFVKEMNQPGGPSAKYATLNLLYKEFPTFSPLGPCIVTADEVDLESLVLRTTVNGETMQEYTVADTAFPIAEAVAHVSAVFLLKPGDIISLGTSAGVGYARRPARYLRPGDEVTVTVDGIGSLRNTVLAQD